MGALILLGIVGGWLCIKVARAFVRAYQFFDTLPPRQNPQPRRKAMSRYPLRIAASIVGALTAVVSSLVGSGLFTADQGNAVTGVITGLVTLLAAFGVVVSTEHKVTPLVDPRTRQRHPLIPAVTTAEAPAGQARSRKADLG